MRKHIKTIDNLFDLIFITKGISKAELIAKNNQQELSALRHCVVYIVKNYLLTNMSYKAIGRAMGGRDHSTMINSKTQVANAISNPKSNPYLYGIYKDIISLCRFEEEERDATLECSIDTLNGMFRQWDNMQGMDFDSKLEVIRLRYFAGGL